MKRWKRPRRHRGARPSEQLRALIEQSEQAAAAATELDHVVLMTPLPGRARPYSGDRSA